jgi:CRISPR/Cas system-associated endonuclease Cas1
MAPVMHKGKFRRFPHPKVLPQAVGRTTRSSKAQRFGSVRGFVRFCARYAIDIILPNGPGRAILFMDGETLRDIGPAVIRAQCAADPVQVAREIVRAKIAADAKGFGPRLTERDFSTLARCEAKLAGARSVAEIIVIEAKAASVYWRSHRDLGLIERKGGNLPRSWLRFANRGRGAEFLGNKPASHPISAMINYCIVVEAGRLARALSGHCLALQIGFLHVDKHGRNSLVWDAIEPLRARIHERVFAFIASHEFARRDFPTRLVSTHRIAQAAKIPSRKTRFIQSTSCCVRACREHSASCSRKLATSRWSL